jgi:CRISPR-associated protein Csb1
MTTTDQQVRRIFKIELEAAAGSRFQPTGFPDLGAAVFKRPIKDDKWQTALLVESAQSMANRLEATAWDTARQAPVGLFDGLPHVRVLDQSGAYLTSSRTESHRLASAFIKDSALDGTSMKQVIRERLGIQQDRPFNLRDIAPAIFALDPFCLVHGVFFADKEWPGQPRVARAVTGFVEAHDVERADSGGVKRDSVRHSIESDLGGSSEGYGSVPFHRVEWVARTILAFFTVDVAQIRSYGLSAPATDLLEAIALWEIRSFVDGPMRLRTACELKPKADVVTDLEAKDSLERRITQLIPQVADLAGGGGAVAVVWDGGKKKPKP